MLTATFGARIAQSRQRMAVLDRSYRRDKDGKFASGGGGVRESLAAATTIGELNTAIAGEAKRITGRDTRVNLKGADLQVGKELGEGVLRGMEHTPSTHLDSVTTYGPGGARKARADEGSGEYANARNRADADTTKEIGFSTEWVGNSAKFRESLAEDDKVTDGVRGSVSSGAGPMGVAIHEFGHVASSQVPHTYEVVTRGKGGVEVDRYKVGVEFEAHHHVMDISERETGSPYGNGIDTGPRAIIGREISSYASWERGEATAEAFADVVLHGDSASQLSHDIYDMVTRGAG